MKVIEVFKKTPREFSSKKFVELYRNFPCLRLIKSKEYYDRIKNTWRIVNKYDDVDPLTDRSVVVKKINKIFKKEQKKTSKCQCWLRVVCCTAVDAEYWTAKSFCHGVWTYVRSFDLFNTIYHRYNHIVGINLITCKAAFTIVTKYTV